jgi:NADH-quinone oxidoreductase subunit C
VSVREQQVTAEQGVERVRSALGQKIEGLEVRFGHLDASCSTDNLRDVLTTLRDEPGLRFEYFTFLSAVDRSEYGGPDDPEKHGGLELLVHLYSPEHVLHINLHVPLDLNEPRCPSTADIFGGANWHEREMHDMFGILFDGHPNLTAIYLPEDFEGHPLRRDFKLPSRSFIKPWPGAKDPEEAAAGGR